MHICCFFRLYLREYVLFSFVIDCDRIKYFMHKIIAIFRSEIGLLVNNITACVSS